MNPIVENEHSNNSASATIPCTRACESDDDPLTEAGGEWMQSGFLEHRVQPQENGELHGGATR